MKKVKKIDKEVAVWTVSKWEDMKRMIRLGVE